MRSLQWVFTYFATVGMIIASVPQLAFAGTRNSTPVTSEYTRKVGEILKSSRKKETIAEVYYRLSIYMSTKNKADLGPILTDKGTLIAPDTFVRGDEIIYSLDGHEARVKYTEEKDGKVGIAVNGQTLTQEQLNSPALLMTTIQKIVSSQPAAKKSAFLWLQLLETPAHADFDWMTLAMGVGLGALAVLAYQFFTTGAGACMFTGAQCCIVSTTYVAGCCATLGGTAATVSPCPVGTSTIPTLPAASALSLPHPTGGNGQP